MKARDLLSAIVEPTNWFDKEKTVDRILYGREDKEIQRLLVTWQADMDCLCYAAEKGYDGIMVHEPLFYIHAREQASLGKWIPGTREGTLKAKMELLDRADLTVIRNHDTWDRIPEVGIPFAWARFLGLGETPAATEYDGYEHAYDIAPTTVGMLAKAIAQKTAAIGEPIVQVLGDQDTPVTRVGLGTGCACWVEGYQRMDCQVGIVVDDGQLYWQDFSYAKDSGFALIRVLHATSEEPGMVSMVKWLNGKDWGIQADYFPFHNRMSWVEAKE